jgi:hypothetical protein
MVYEAQAATALRLLAKFGEVSTIERKTETPSATPWRPAAAAVDSFAVSAAWLGISYSSPISWTGATEYREDGGMVSAGDETVLVAASGLDMTPDPVTDSIIRASGQRYAIVRVESLNVNGEAILYILRVR